MLPAHNRRPKYRRFQLRPAAWHEPDGHHRKRKEMDNPQHIEVDLVDWIDCIADDFRHVDAELRKVPGHRYAERKENVANRQYAGNGRIDPRAKALRAAERAPGAEHEQQVPGKGIEHPDAWPS